MGTEILTKNKYENGNFVLTKRISKNRHDRHEDGRHEDGDFDKKQT